ncbi:MAG: mitofilin family membrane protein [Pseudomonadota bacterium]
MTAEKVADADTAPETGSPEAEPVAMTAKNPEIDANKETPDTSEAGTVEGGGKQNADGGSQEPPIAPSGVSPKARSGSPLLGGLVGGVIALLGAAGFQWAGFIPNLGANSFDTSVMEAKIEGLGARLSTAEDVLTANSGAETVTVLVEEIGQSASSNMDAIAAIDTQVDEMMASIDRLNSAIASGEAGDSAAVGNLAARFAELETQNETLAAELADLPTGGASLDAVSAIEAELRGTIAALADDVNRLSGEVGALTEQVAVGGADSTAVARAFAASSLKNAVDRGGAFGAELEAFATVAQSSDNDAVATLRSFASGGVPTLSQLVDAYPAVANAIIASERIVDENAGIGQRLLNNMQGLVSVRPVDEQVGDTPTAITTRIGARLAEGDLSAALTEWEALPDTAKLASQAYVDQVRARQTVDGLLSGMLTQAMSGAAPNAQ